MTRDHDRYEHELNNIAESHSKSIQAKDNVKLKAVGAGGGDLHARVPKTYQAIDQSVEGETDGFVFTHARRRTTALYMSSQHELTNENDGAMHDMQPTPGPK